jgi:hypothetical protein
MSQLVRIAPGVVFSSDVLGVEWVCKFRADDAGDARHESAESSTRRRRPDKESAQTIDESSSRQMSLL